MHFPENATGKREAILARMAESGALERHDRHVALRNQNARLAGSCEQVGGTGVAMNRTRILYVIGSLRIGGAEGHLVQVVRHLDPMRYDVHVACLSEGGPLEAPLREIGVPVTILGLKGLRHQPPQQAARLLLQIWRQFREIRPDIVHTYLFWANIIGAVLGKLAGARAIITSRRSLGVFKDNHKYYQLLENMVNRITDAVTVNSLGVLSDVLQREQLPKHKIHLIYNGIMWERYTEKPLQYRLDTLRSELGIPNGVPVIGCIANLIYYKGHADLLEAMPLILATHPHVHLLLVGRDGGVEDQLKRHSIELGIQEYVHFVGSRQDVADLLHLLDVQVLPSHEEGFSNAILEGMAAGRPLVVSRVGGNPEAVIDGITGLVVPPRSPVALSEAISELLSNPAYATELGRKAQERVRREFSIARMMQSLELLYQNVLAGRSLKGYL